MMARAGAILAPTLTHLNIYWAPSAYLAVVVLGSVNLVVSFALLVETKGVRLETVKLDDAAEESSHEMLKMIPTTDTNLSTLSPTKT